MILGYKLQGVSKIEETGSMTGYIRDRNVPFYSVSGMGVFIFRPFKPYLFSNVNYYRKRLRPTRSGHKEFQLSRLKPSGRDYN